MYGFIQKINAYSSKTAINNSLELVLIEYLFISLLQENQEMDSVQHNIPNIHNIPKIQCNIPIYCAEFWASHYWIFHLQMSGFSFPISTLFQEYNIYSLASSFQTFLKDCHFQTKSDIKNWLPLICSINITAYPSHMLHP